MAWNIPQTVANAKVVTPGPGGWEWDWGWAVWDQGWMNWTGHGVGCLDPVRPQTVPLCAAWMGPSSSPSPHPDKAVPRFWPHPGTFLG